MNAWLVRASSQLRRRASHAGPWALEVVGIGLLALAGSTWHDGLAPLVGGLYLVIIANRGGGDAGTR